MKFNSSSENFLTEDANNRLRKVTAQPLGVICTRGLPILSEIQAGRLAITFASSVEGEESLDISQKPLHCGIPPNKRASTHTHLMCLVCIWKRHLSILQRHQNEFVPQDPPPQKNNKNNYNNNNKKSINVGLFSKTTKHIDFWHIGMEYFTFHAVGERIHFLAALVKSLGKNWDFLELKIRDECNWMNRNPNTTWNNQKLKKNRWIMKKNKKNIRWKNWLSM